LIPAGSTSRSPGKDRAVQITWGVRPVEYAWVCGWRHQTCYRYWMAASGMRGVTATRRAYDYAKQRILDNTWPGGELVSEGDVADALGISRTPVREAFLQLESEGLLRLYPKRGALVVPVSAQEIEAVLESRLMVEDFALRKVLARGIDVTKDLERSLERQEKVVSAGRVAKFAEADREFHRVLVAAIGNPIALSLYDALRDRGQRMFSLRAAVANDMPRIFDEHRAIVDAIRAGDQERAREALARHIGSAREALVG
jgi:DNA-binding GntR family transcriptional regulator